MSTDGDEGRPRLVTPERLYVVALGLSGAAALVSVALPPRERGFLVACVASATLGAAIGGFSVDTFLLSRPAGWVASRRRSWVVTITLASVALSAAVAVVVMAIAGIGSSLVAAGAACALTAFNISASLALRLGKFRFVYAARAVGAVALIGGYLWLYVHGQLTGGAWSAVWLSVQVLVAVGMIAAVLRWALADRAGVLSAPATALVPEYRDDVLAMGKLHAGICAHIMVARLDQIALARFAGSASLGVYALAVAALEFAQAGAVVTAQRILVRRERGNDIPTLPSIVRPALPIALVSLVALAVLGIMRPQYGQAWLLGLCLLPGCLAACAGKTWSAVLLRRSGERATTLVALLVLALALPSYLVLIPRMGATGAAVAVSFVYVGYAVATWLSLRRAPAPVVHGTV